LRNPIDKALNRGYVLLPLVGTSPPPGDASPLWALYTGHGLLALPGGGRGNTRMTYGVSIRATGHVLVAKRRFVRS
jgi:hypothetical protein